MILRFHFVNFHGVCLLDIAGISFLFTLHDRPATLLCRACYTPTYHVKIGTARDAML